MSQEKQGYTTRGDGYYTSDSEDEMDQVFETKSASPKKPDVYEAVVRVTQEAGELNIVVESQESGIASDENGSPIHGVPPDMVAEPDIKISNEPALKASSQKSSSPSPPRMAQVKNGLKTWVYTYGWFFENDETFVRKALKGLKIKEVVFKNTYGYSDGGCYIELENEQEFEYALKFDKTRINGNWARASQRYVRVEIPPKQDLEYLFEHIKKNRPCEKDGFGYVAIGSLPYQTTREEIKLAFEDCQVEELILGPKPRAGEKPFNFRAYLKLASKNLEEVALKKTGNELGGRYATWLLQVYRMDGYAFVTEKKKYASLQNKREPTLRPQNRNVPSPRNRMTPATSQNSVNSWAKDDRNKSEVDSRQKFGWDYGGWGDDDSYYQKTKNPFSAFPTPKGWATKDNNDGPRDYHRNSKDSNRQDMVSPAPSRASQYDDFDNMPFNGFGQYRWQEDDDGWGTSAAVDERPPRRDFGASTYKSDATGSCKNPGFGPAAATGANRAPLAPMRGRGRGFGLTIGIGREDFGYGPTARKPANRFEVMDSRQSSRPIGSTKEAWKGAPMGYGARGPINTSRQASTKPSNDFWSVEQEEDWNSALKAEKIDWSAPADDGWDYDGWTFSLSVQRGGPEPPRQKHPSSSSDKKNKLDKIQTIRKVSTSPSTATNIKDTPTLLRASFPTPPAASTRPQHASTSRQKDPKSLSTLKPIGPPPGLNRKSPSREVLRESSESSQETFVTAASDFQPRPESRCSTVSYKSASSMVDVNKALIEPLKHSLEVAKASLPEDNFIAKTHMSNSIGLMSAIEKTFNDFSDELQKLREENAQLKKKDEISAKKEADLKAMNLKLKNQNNEVMEQLDRAMRSLEATQDHRRSVKNEVIEEDDEKEVEFLLENVFLDKTKYPKETFDCEICGIRTNSNSQLENHLQGKSHRVMLESYRAPRHDPDAYPPRNDGIFGEVVNITNETQPSDDDLAQANMSDLQ